VHNPHDLPAGDAKDYEVYELSAKDGQACSQLSKDGYTCRCTWILRSYEPADPTVPGSLRKKNAAIVDETLVGTWVYKKDFILDDHKRVSVNAVICAKMTDAQYKQFVTSRPLPEPGHAPKTDAEYEKEYKKALQAGGGNK